MNLTKIFNYQNLSAVAVGLTTSVIACAIDPSITKAALSFAAGFGAAKVADILGPSETLKRFRNDRKP